MELMKRNLLMTVWNIKRNPFITIALLNRIFRLVHKCMISYFPSDEN